MNFREGKMGARTDRGVLPGPTAGHAGQTNKIHLSHSAKSAFLELMDENRGPERQSVSTSLLPVASPELWPCSFCIEALPSFFCFCSSR